jgi:hypothetical protein
LVAVSLSFIGCASTPKTLTIKNETALPQENVPSPQTSRNEPVTQSVDAPAAPVMSEHAAREGQIVPAATQSAPAVQNEPPAQSADAPAPAANESAASGAQTVPAPTQTGIPMVAERNSDAASNAAADKDRVDIAAPNGPDELQKSIQDQVKSEITASVREEIEGLEEQVSGGVRNDMLREIWTLKQELKDREEERKDDAHNEMLRELWAIKQEFKQAAATEWTKRFKFSGDIRLRYEHDFLDKDNFTYVPKFDNPPDSSSLNYQNTTIDQERFKYRVRFGVEAKVNDTVDALLRLSTGSTSNPDSANSTMGDYMNRDAVFFDQAYIKWRPGQDLTLYGGRMPNPWFSSDLVWANDLNFEGFALQVKQPVSETATPFLTTGAFPLQQNDFTQHGKWLLGGQLGLDRKSKKGAAARIGAAYYDFRNITGVENDFSMPSANNWTAPLFFQKGNTLMNISAVPNANTLALAAEFKELNVTGTLDLGFWDPVHIMFLGDYVKNLAFKKADVAQRTGVADPPKEVEGYQFGMSVGYPVVQDAGQWKTYLYAKHLERDAVVDAFTDTDFHLGGTNAKGWILGGDVGLAKNFWLTLRWLTADEISGPPLAIDVLQVDLNAKF